MNQCQILIRINSKEAERIRDLAAESLQTMCAFIGSGGKSVKIICSFRLPDASTPQCRNLAEKFHAHAYRRAASYYMEQLQKQVEFKRPDLERGCRFSYDPQLYFNPEAVSIKINQPLHMPAELTYREAVQKETEPMLRMMPGWSEAASFPFYSKVLLKRRSKVPVDQRRITIQSLS